MTSQKIESNISNPVLFADDTSIIVTKHNNTEFKNDSKKVFGYINERFRINKLFLVFDKIYYLQFITKNSHKIKTEISLRVLNYQYLQYQISCIIR